MTLQPSLRCVRSLGLRRLRGLSLSGPSTDRLLLVAVVLLYLLVGLSIVRLAVSPPGADGTRFGRLDSETAPAASYAGAASGAVRERGPAPGPTGRAAP